MANIKVYREDYIPTPRQQLWNTFCENYLALGGLWFLIFLLILIVFHPLLTSYASDMQNINAMLTPPLWSASGQIEYILGTDDLGRDLYSRLIEGSALTFGYALLIVLFSFALGSTIGSLLAMIKGFKGNILGHLLDTMLSIPSLLMAILIVAMMGPSQKSVFIAISLAMIPQFIFAIYNKVRTEINKEYIVAAKLDGANYRQIVVFVLLPNLWDTVIVQTTYSLSAAILDIATLGFLGLGGEASSPEWGTMVAQGIDNLWTASWSWILPGLAILLTVLAVNLVGDGLRSALQPKG
tara:strand:+ start:2506 stop:3393 length:888 start_codon:yes stop_codon:yes gene_type:complete